MTKKHFIAIAKEIKAQMDVYENEHDDIAVNVRYGIERTARALCTVFRAENELFDESRFLTACGITQ